MEYHGGMSMAEFPLPEQSKRTVQFTAAFEFDNPVILPVLRPEPAKKICQSLRRDPDIRWMAPVLDAKYETARDIGMLILYTFAMEEDTSPLMVMTAGAGHVYDLLDEHGIKDKSPLYAGVRTHVSGSNQEPMFDHCTMEVSILFQRLTALKNMKPEDFADNC